MKPAAEFAGCADSAERRRMLQATPAESRCLRFGWDAGWPPGAVCSRL